MRMSAGQRVDVRLVGVAVVVGEDVLAHRELLRQRDGPVQERRQLISPHREIGAERRLRGAAGDAEPGDGVDVVLVHVAGDVGEALIRGVEREAGSPEPPGEEGRHLAPAEDRVRRERRVRRP